MKKSGKAKQADLGERLYGWQTNILSDFINLILATY